MSDRLRPRAPLVAPPVDAPADAAVRALAGARGYVDVVVPGTEPPAKGRMRLVGVHEDAAITAEARRYFTSLGLPDDPAACVRAGLLPKWNNELAMRLLAVAVRATDDGPPLASLDEWGACDEWQIAALYQQYQDLEERLDPLRDDGTLTDAEFTQVANAVKKKDAAVLRSFGSRKLSLYMLTTVDPPAS